MSNYVNHNLTLANVRLEWSSPENSNHVPKLLEMDVSSLSHTLDRSSKLAMDMIALRDIQPDEEIFLDYGGEWEAAWTKHVDSWKPVPRAAHYWSAADLNCVDGTTIPMSTEFELLERPRNEEVDLLCFSGFEDSRWKTFYERGKINQYLEFNRGYPESCDLLRYRRDSDGSILYTAMMWKYSDEGEPEETGMLVDVPKVALVYEDTPYSNDVHLPNAFRHDMRIPDRLFPGAWKNRQ
jgi:hypothetical protein